MISSARSLQALSRRNMLRLSAIGGLVSFAGKDAYADAPKRGGRMRLGSRHGSTTDSTDPGLITNAFQGYLAYAFTSTLTEILPDGTLGPALALSWDSTDAKTWQFKLRKDVTFHNGQPFTAADVVASLNHHRIEGSVSSVKPFADQMVQIKAEGTHEIIIELKSANADLPASFNDAAFTIFPATGEKADWQSRNGTGGYIIEQYEPGVLAKLKRNPNYWRSDRAFADEVELLCLVDATARTNALLSGDIDAIDEVDLKSIEFLSSQPGITIEETAGPLHYTFPMRTDVAPFDNLDVRLALKYAIDRKAILDNLLYGHGSIGNDTPIGPSYPYFAADIERNSYDPEKSKFHLKRAGLENLTVDLSAAEAAFTGAVDAALLFSEQAKKANISINVIREANDGYWDNIWTKKPFCAAYWGGYTSESQMFAMGYAPGAAWNDTYWTEPGFESLRLAAAGEIDPVKRRTMYTEMQTILRDRGGAIVFAFATNVMARNQSVAHGKLATSNVFDGGRVAERWWVV
jgi:peptide/nickel transport system substrate-binding protein